MDYDLNPSTALYGIAAFLGAATVIYFGSSLVFDLSPVTKSLAFFTASAIFLAASLYLSERNKLHSIISIAMTGISYVAFLVYSLGKFDIGTEGVFISLFLSSILFVALGYLSNRGKLRVEKDQLKYFFGAVVVLGAGLILFDVAGAQPSYSLELKDSVTLEPGQQAVLGNITISNKFLLPREVSTPHFDTCFSNREDRRSIYIDADSENILAGRSEVSVNLTASVPPSRFINESRIFGVERSDSCPDQLDNDTLYIFRTGEDPVLAYVD